MAQKIKFNFKEKEGKFFAPIVGKTTKYVDGTKTLVPQAGLKGTYGIMRLELPEDVNAEDGMPISSKRGELFAMSTEMFISSR